MLFKEIQGNNIIKKQLIDSVFNDRVSHSQLLNGKCGSAKLQLAIAYAQYLNCSSRLEEDSCGTCSSCTKYESLTHPDLHLIFPVIKSNSSKVSISDNFVDLWRDYILDNPYGSLNGWIDLLSTQTNKLATGGIYKEEANVLHKKLAFKNYEAQYRVIIIWMPEKMNLESSNSLLKLLEEPPKGTVFLLISENIDLLIATIKSRLQIIQVNDFTLEDMINYFPYKGKSEILKLKKITNSSLGQMITYFQNDIEDDNFLENFTLWMRYVYKVDIINISNWVDEMSQTGKVKQRLFLIYATKMIRECLIINFSSNTLSRVNEEEYKFVTKFASFINEENSISIFETLELTIKSIDRNANPKILFFELSLKMIKFLKVKSKFVNK
jgi:DNA polymerase-3 subunit delta'